MNFLYTSADNTIEEYHSSDYGKIAIKSCRRSLHTVEWCHDTQHNDTQHNNIQHKGLFATLSITAQVPLC